MKKWLYLSGALLLLSVVAFTFSNTKWFKGSVTDADVFSVALGDITEVVEGDSVYYTVEACPSGTPVGIAVGDVAMTVVDSEATMWIPLDGVFASAALVIDDFTECVTYTSDATAISDFVGDVTVTAVLTIEDESGGAYDFTDTAEATFNYEENLYDMGFGDDMTAALTEFSAYDADSGDLGSIMFSVCMTGTDIDESVTSLGTLPLTYSIVKDVEGDLTEVATGQTDLNTGEMYGQWGVTGGAEGCVSVTPLSLSEIDFDAFGGLVDQEMLEVTFTLDGVGTFEETDEENNTASVNVTVSKIDTSASATTSVESPNLFFDTSVSALTHTLGSGTAVQVGACLRPGMLDSVDAESLGDLSIYYTLINGTTTVAEDSVAVNAKAMYDAWVATESCVDVDLFSPDSLSLTAGDVLSLALQMDYSATSETGLLEESTEIDNGYTMTLTVAAASSTTDTSTSGGSSSGSSSSGSSGSSSSSSSSSSSDSTASTSSSSSSSGGGGGSAQGRDGDVENSSGYAQAHADDDDGDTDSSISREDTDNPFVDIKPSDWYYPYILDLYEQGIFEGKSGHRAAPTDKLTRAQGITFALRLMGYAEDDFKSKTLSNPYRDEKTSNWHYYYVLGALSLGVVDAATVFEPDDQMNRAEFITVLMRASGVESAGVSEVSMPKDVKSSDWFAKAVATAIRDEVAEGYSDNTFKATKKVNRAEAATMMSRAIEAGWFKL
jgi:hypothetical protein